ncbi:metal-dependent hydrolase [Altererythrobacter arenosus]|uniref:Metal-dependent hydrolase n=1 Tax=Altererythrobacter arenosus TaxID=3032592 RepID=A0ABY8FYZ4_9SPHN|nr:metal-dependent hydrolase [Altererythrobacter sp. CAU 1644]WFL77224.1 metal-dependent hydrolase [Altererythrobacter sp. CAU 1644]
MDNLTHSLVGALLGQAGLKKKTGLAMPALIIGANLPDVDAACLFWLEGVEHLGFRRGITHGPPAMVLLPLVLTGILWGFDRWQARRGTRPEGRLPVSFKWLYLLSFIGCLTHPALDWLNVYGIRLLEPFSSQWFYGDTLFIIDVWLWALLGFATWFSLRREKRGGEWKRPAQLAIAVALAYIGMNWVITWVVASMASGQPAIASPMPISSWKREVIEPYRRDQWLIEGETVGDCRLAPILALGDGNSQVDAFLFWSRAPFAERAEDGSVILRDARFYDPRARDRFAVALPDVKCEELPAD